MNTPFEYDVQVDWTSERLGKLSADKDGLPSLEVATPPEFPKGHANIWSPEHLFVAAVNSCLMTTFLAIAENSKLSFRSFSSKARGILEKTDKGLAITKILLMPQVEIDSEKDAERAYRILEKAEKHCLISNSITAEISMEAKVNIAALA